jgi:hypothetical protein
MRHAIGSTFDTSVQALTALSAGRFHEFAVLELKDADEVVRPEIISPFLDNYGNCLGDRSNSNLFFSLFLQNGFTALSPDIGLGSSIPSKQSPERDSGFGKIAYQ